MMGKILGNEKELSWKKNDFAEGFVDTLRLLDKESFGFLLQIFSSETRLAISCIKRPGTS